MRIKAIALLMGITILGRPALTAVKSYDDQGHRPKFDKTPYLKTVWSQANPWWILSDPAGRSVYRTRFMSDYSWHRFSDDHARQWEQAALRYKRYGLTGLQWETIVKSGHGNIFGYKGVLEGFRRAGNGMMLVPLVTDITRRVMTPNQKEEYFALLEKGYLDLFRQLSPELFKHPNAYRLNGAPVVAFYLQPKLPTADARRLISIIESKYGKCIWLFNKRSVPLKQMADYLQMYDGTTQYGQSDSGNTGYVKTLRAKAALIKERFPQKIFECTAHTNWTQHRHYGGQRPRLSANYRFWWREMMRQGVNALSLTNWFDISENSRVMPSYQLDDVRLRIARHHIEGWRGGKAAPTPTPDLYAGNYISVRLGEKMLFEVLGFPVKGGISYPIRLEVCASNGKVLKSFPVREFNGRTLQSHVFELPSLPYAEYRSVHPRLSWQWRGKWHTTALFPHTILEIGLPRHLLYWFRSVRHMVPVENAGKWRLNGKGPGETLSWPKDGYVRLHSEITHEEPPRHPAHLAYIKRIPQWKARHNHWEPRLWYGGQFHLMQNGRELINVAATDLKMNRIFPLPNPRWRLDFYNIEFENRDGHRYLSPPVWVTANRRRGKVRLPVLDDEDGKVKTVSVEAARVPCRYGPTGPRAIGLETGQKVWGGEYIMDEDGKYCLAYNGKGGHMISYGGAYPYASTYEMWVKADKLGRPQCLIGSYTGQVYLTIGPDGHVTAARTSGKPGSYRGPQVKVVSKNRLRAGRWVHVAAVYDMKELRLYMDGKEEGAVECRPCRSLEQYNQLTIAQSHGRYHVRPLAGKFKGRLRHIRMVERNLSPKELLVNRPDPAFGTN